MPGRSDETDERRADPTPAKTGPTACTEELKQPSSDIRHDWRALFLQSQQVVEAGAGNQFATVAEVSKAGCPFSSGRVAQPRPVRRRAVYWVLTQCPASPIVTGKSQGDNGVPGPRLHFR